jgi:hypothetical protein
MAIAGRVAIVPKGDWSADATYKRLDAVTYNNTLYFAKKEVPAGTATSNTEYWSKSIVGSASAIATTEDAGVVKPDGKSMSVDESGTLSINLDGTTITLDEAKNVIKLADALKEKIGSALQPESIANNQITTVEGFALDARQANPNLDGTLAKQVADLNGSLKIKNVQWTPYCPRTNFADKVLFQEENAMQYGSLVICSIRIELLENTPGEYVYIVNLPKKAFRGINQTNMDGKTGLWYLDAVNECVVLRSVFEAGIYYFSFTYLAAE